MYEYEDTLNDLEKSEREGRCIMEDSMLDRGPTCEDDIPW